MERGSRCHFSFPFFLLRDCCALLSECSEESFARDEQLKIPRSRYQLERRYWVVLVYFCTEAPLPGVPLQLIPALHLRYFEEVPHAQCRAYTCKRYPSSLLRTLYRNETSRSCRKQRQVGLLLQRTRLSCSIQQTGRLFSRRAKSAPEGLAGPSPSVLPQRPLPDVFARSEPETAPSSLEMPKMQRDSR